jgi:hypothetical protein
VVQLLNGLLQRKHGSMLVAEATRPS